MRKVNLYVYMHGCLLQVPPKTDFISAFDLFYKVHSVFNLPFSDDFKQLMIFFDHYVYRVCNKKNKPTSKTTQFAIKVLKNNADQ